MTDHDNDEGVLDVLYHEAYDVLGAADISTPDQAVTSLTRALEAVTAARDEALAEAVAAGSSMRSVAELAGIAPNSVSNRLARSASLGPYAEGSRVTASGIARARHDTTQHQGEPMRFVRRTSEES